MTRSDNINNDLLPVTRNQLHATAADIYGDFLRDNAGVLGDSSNRAHAFRVFFSNYVNNGRRPAPSRYIILIRILELCARQCGMTTREWANLMSYGRIRHGLNRVFNRIPVPQPANP
jgi:hypothetical protein